MSSVAMGIFLTVCFVVIVIIGVLSAIDSVKVAEQKRARTLPKRAAEPVAKSNDDEGIYTHAEVLASLPDEVLRGLGFYRAKNGSVKPVVEPCVVTQEPYLAGSGKRAVRLTCHCGWKQFVLASAEDRIKQRTAQHLASSNSDLPQGGGHLTVPNDVVRALSGGAPGDAVVLPFMLQTSQPQHVWYEYNDDDQRLTLRRPTRPSPTRGVRY